MISIATKVKLITFVLSITMVFNIFMTYYLIQDEKADAKIINIAGKQRMLTQKMIVESHRLEKDKKGAKEALLQAQETFKTNLKRLDSGDLHIGEHKEVSALLQEVRKAWIAFEAALQEGSNSSSIASLENIYIRGNITLAKMEKTVLAYEQHATSKRDFINQIQLVFGLMTILIIIYMGIVSLGIDTQLSAFLKHSKNISGRDSSNKGDELELACAHIQYVLDDVESAIDSARIAVEQSEIASRKLSTREDGQALKHLDKSEDIVIEANEELYKTSKRLKDLKTKLQDAANPNFN